MIEPFENGGTIDVVAPKHRPKTGQARADNGLIYRDLHTAHQIADRWGVSVNEVRKLLRRGDLPFERFENAVRVPLKWLKMFEAANGISVAAERQ